MTERVVVATEYTLLRAYRSLPQKALAGLRTREGTPVPLLIFNPMGVLISKLFNAINGGKECRVLMLGLDAAGKTTMCAPSHLTMYPSKLTRL